MILFWQWLQHLLYDNSISVFNLAIASTSDSVVFADITEVKTVVC